MISDFESFLHVGEDRRIWWLRQDAIRLGAGFLPASDDNRHLEPRLQAPNQRALVNEKRLMAALGDSRSKIPKPIMFERDGFCYVDAAGFLEWLSQYICQTQAKIEPPNELVNQVKIALAKAAAERSRSTPQTFESLTLALEGWFHKERLELPEALRRRVEFEFFPAPWDGLSAAQRRSAALQLDYQHDPATEADRRKWWDFLGRKYDLEKQIRHWETVACPTAEELALKEDRLRGMRDELARMERLWRSAPGDYYPQPNPVDGARGATAGRWDPSAQYLAYPKAMRLLADRLGATRDELAAWVWLGQKDGGLDAYQNANELAPPPRFFYDFSDGGFDYLLPLMGCWFREDDIHNFEPADRFITGAALIERWGKQPDIQPEAFIRAKIAESRLDDCHPIYGGTQGTCPEQPGFPPLASGLFPLAQIEAIEAADFAAIDEHDEPTDGSCQPVSAWEIWHHFLVIRNEDANEKWWKAKMADADRYGLLDCRVGEGRKGPGGSLWRPDLIAAWLVDRHAKDCNGLSVDAARAALRKFPGCEEIAEEMFPPDD